MRLAATDVREALQAVLRTPGVTWAAVVTESDEVLESVGRSGVPDLPALASTFASWRSLLAKVGGDETTILFEDPQPQPRGIQLNRIGASWILVAVFDTSQPSTLSQVRRATSSAVENINTLLVDE
jgi:hypothetical protein